MYRVILVLTVLLVALMSFAVAQAQKTPKRDTTALDILARTINAAGGSQAIAAVQDITESGQITFESGERVTGSLTVKGIGQSHFRIEANLPDENKVWIVNNGRGTKTVDGKQVPMTNDGAINLVNLTYPVAHVAAVLADSAADVSFVGIERRNGRSVYRLRAKGRLGLIDAGSKDNPVTKDILVDALRFEVVSIEDRPFPARGSAASSDSPTRAVEFQDFRVVDAIRVPFVVQTKLAGQEVLDITLSQVSFNKNLTVADFQ